MSAGGDGREGTASWRVTLDVFSGRPNPTWRLAGAAAEDLERRLRAALPAPRGAPVQPPDLGYRGFLLGKQPAAEGEMRVYGGWISGPEGRWLDPGRGLERWLLASAGDRLERPVFEHVLHAIEERV